MSRFNTLNQQQAMEEAELVVLGRLLVHSEQDVHDHCPDEIHLQEKKTVSFQKTWAQTNA